MIIDNACDPKFLSVSEIRAYLYFSDLDLFLNFKTFKELICITKYTLVILNFRLFHSSLTAQVLNFNYLFLKCLPYSQYATKIYPGFVLSMEYLEKYGIQLSVFKVKYKIQSCVLEKYGFFRTVLNFCILDY